MLMTFVSIGVAAYFGEKEDVPVVKLGKSKELNGDITAWLYSPDTVINYPVCYGEDNKDYLTHLADGK